MKIAVIGNFLPRKCGIATFTENFIKSVTAAGVTANDAISFDGFAIDDFALQHQYDPQVRYTIRRQHQEDYIEAARIINTSGATVCVLQHEFGIFGGESGVFILSLLRKLTIPVVTIFHTVLKKPSFHEKAITIQAGNMSAGVVVMSQLAAHFLHNLYDIPKAKIRVIHHGVPDFANQVATHPLKQLFPGKTILCTFGLLGRSKGIETVINALPAVLELNKDFVYVVLGKTHPNVKKHCGEEYREFLQAMARQNSVSDNVFFIDEFVDEDMLKQYLLDVDIYITPYLNESQITSGTLSYAVGAGTCIVSTPFWHATELLADGRGELFGFGDKSALSTILCKLLQNPCGRATISKKAFTYGKQMYWSHIGELHLELLREVSQGSDNGQQSKMANYLQRAPAFSLAHINRLTDDTGILEHACFSIANFKEGYCLDDNARALLLVSQAYRQGLNNNSLRLADVYLRYIKLMQKEDGSFYNDYTYDRRIMENSSSEDAFGRTVWVMGYLIELGINDAYTQFAKDTFFRAVPHIAGLASLRGISNSIIGLCYFLRRYPDNEHINHLLVVLTGKLVDQYNLNKTSNWSWFEQELTYDNAIMPLALWHACSVTRNSLLQEVAIASTAFIDEKVIVDNKLSLIGNQRWHRNGGERSGAGQQPIDAMGMVLLHQQAFTVTKEKKHYKKMLLCYTWFLGNNDLQLPLYDSETKGCCDGLEQYAVNRNQGAESAISYCLSSLTVRSTIAQVKALSKAQAAQVREIPSKLRLLSPAVSERKII